MNSTTTQTTATIEIGMGATVYGWSDTQAWTVIAVSKSGREVTLQRDKATLLNGGNSGEADALKFDVGGFCAHVSGEQRYEIERDPEGITRKFSLRNNGTWRAVGESAKGGQRAILGKRHEDYDFNF